MNMKRATCLTLMAALLALVVTGCDKGPAQDEAKQAGKTVADFPEATEDYFHDMDGGVSMTDKEIKGRNTWLVWTEAMKLSGTIWPIIAMAPLTCSRCCRPIHARLSSKPMSSRQPPRPTARTLRPTTAITIVINV